MARPIKRSQQTTPVRQLDNGSYFVHAPKSDGKLPASLQKALDHLGQTARSIQTADRTER